jgi:hypothetical protein
MHRHTNLCDTGEAFGVSGTTASPQGAGVNGFALRANGVNGTSTRSDGVVGVTEGGASGVRGIATASGKVTFGVHGSSDSTDPRAAGVFGFSKRSNGVLGQSDGGYGGHFAGARAPLRLQPAAGEGPPTSGPHLAGEFFVDRNGDLFFCRQGGSPGAWFRVQLVPA